MPRSFSQSFAEVREMFVKICVRSLLSLMVLSSAMGLAAGGHNQDGRPRYNSGQYGERSWTVPEDTVISLRMNRSLGSKTARVGDRFTATVTIPHHEQGRAVIPAGAIVEGRVTQVTPAKRMSKAGSIAVDFDNLVFPNGSRVNLVGILTSDDPEARRRMDDEGRVSGRNTNRPEVFVGGGGAIGAILGGMAGGGKGAVLGGIAGAGAGIAGVLLSKGEEAQVPSGTPFGIQLRQALVIRESFIDDGRTQIARQSQDAPVNRQETQQPVRDDRDDRKDVSQPDPVSEPTSDPTPPPVTTPGRANDEALPEPSDPQLPLSSPEMIRRAQIALKEQGYYEGQADGVMNPRTSTALKTFQRENNLPQTGDLDPETAKRLGIVSATNASKVNERRPDRTAAAEVVLANVLSASAARTAEGGIQVLVNTQANTGGWRWFGEHVVNGDTLEVYARAVKPSGIVTQVLTRGRIELNVRDRVQYVRRVIVHGAGGDLNVPLGGNATSVSPVSRPSAVATGTNPVAGSSLQRQAEELLSEYQRALGIRLTGTGVEIDSRGGYDESQIELLFALDSFANAAQLYVRLAGSLRNGESLRGATLAVAREARRADRVITTTSSPLATPLARRWDAIRQDVLKLMHAYNISSSELDN